MSRFRPKLMASAAVATALAALVAGCTSAPSSSPSSTPGSSSSSAVSSANLEVGGPLTQTDIDTTLKYVGGTAGKADSSKTPVKIGVINDEGGVPSFPEVTPAVQAAASLVNDKLGGVDGHPVQIVSCNVVNGDADGLKCAQQFANDPSIASVQLGMTPVGAGPVYSTIGTKKNIIGFGPFSAADLVPEGVSFYTATTYSMAPAALLYAKNELKATSIAVVYDGTDPGVIGNAQVEKQIASQVGIKVTAVPASNSSQWSSALISAGAKTAGAIAVLGGEGVCIPAAQAVKQLGLTAPVITFNFCEDSAVKQALGDYPTWNFLSPTAPFIGTDTADTVAYRDAMNTYSPSGSLGGSAPGDFGILLTEVKAFNSIGYDKLTADSIRNYIRSFAGPTFMGSPTSTCGKWASMGAPSLCNTYASVVTYKGNGQWSDPTNGAGIDTGNLGIAKQ